MTAITDPLTLPCGAVLPNRLCKAAMTEGLAPGGVPGDDLVRLYTAWGAGGCGLLLTGNVQVARDGLERHGNVVIDREPDAAMRAALTRWSTAAKSNGAKIWMQISHAGRQTPIRVNKHPKAPSAVILPLPGKMWGEPVALTEPEIEDLIVRFVRAARVASETGFDGAQIHAAHGYLISQFLSPRANIRQDKWGGSLENRARFLMEIVKATKAAVGPGFAVSVKLNSADFQKGGFEFEDSLTVAGWLADAGVDMLEVSGGTYEQPRMMNTDGLKAPDQPKAASTRAREAYFLDFARAMMKGKAPPLMVTGGFRSAESMSEALSEGVGVVGLGRPLCADTDAARTLLKGGTLERWEDRLRVGPGVFGPASPVPIIKALNALSAQSWFYQQLRHIGAGRKPDLKLKPLRAYFAEHRDEAKMARATA
jgi:2,4-dienoyl-CoA reductase-like NADH-dependent reductase (Old Yellow Enzyme family)